jgi:hypothetical protein
MNTAPYSYLVISTDGTAYASLASHYERKVGDRVQTSGGWWGKVFAVCKNMAEANAFIGVVIRENRRKAAAAYRQQQREDALFFLNLCRDAGISNDLLQTAGLIK